MLPAGLALLQNIFQHFASLLIIGSTGGVLVILLTWFRYRVEHNVRSVMSTSKLVLLTINRRSCTIALKAPTRAFS